MLYASKLLCTIVLPAKKRKKEKKKMISPIQICALWLMTLLLLFPVAKSADQFPNTKPGCQKTCGDVSVPYPFGINSPDCAINNYFILNCTHSNNTTPPVLLLGTNIPVRNISLLNGTLTISIYAAFDCYNKLGVLVKSFSQSPQLGATSPFTFSDTGNVFTTIGCDTAAMVRNEEATFGAACLSLCSDPINMTDGNPCAGTGCCQSSIPKGLKSLHISVDSLNKHLNVTDFNPCGFAFLAEKSSLRLSDWQLSVKPHHSYTSDVLIEWVARDGMCQEEQGSNVCGENAVCYYSESGGGYRCSCKPGFQGNPYLKDGCQDIEECDDSERYPCQGRCHNTIGDYICSCPIGMYGDGKIACRGFSITTIGAVSGASISLATIAMLFYLTFTKRRKYKNFIKNGGSFLKNRFTEAELRRATKNFDDGQKLGEGGFGSVYKGILADNTKIAVKKCKGVDEDKDFNQEMYIVSQVNHKNVVKLLGFCLETQVPLLVYEYISNGNLSEHIHEQRSHILKTWRNRLRVAAEAALALDYLHSLADPPIIHGDVKSVNILLDDKYTVKMADFGASILVSAEKTPLSDKIKGTIGYLDPEYLMTGIMTEKSDVYSFGVVLVELLTGLKPITSVKSGEEKSNVIQCFVSSLEDGCVSEILGFKASAEDEMEEVQEVAELAKKCVNGYGINRPTMKQVSGKLAQLNGMHENSITMEKSQESPALLDESRSFSTEIQNREK